jgi:hypothetical protein
VTLHAGDTRAAAVQIDGVWQPLAARSTTIVEVDGPFAVASVCATEGSTQSETWLLGPGDGDEHWLPCQRPATEVTIVAELVDLNLPDDEPRPEVYVGTSRVEELGTTATRIAPGTYDVVAFERTVPYRYVIQRGVTIEDDTTLTIDFDADGEPLAVREVTIGGESIAEGATVQVTAEIGTTRADLFSNSGTAHVFPDGAADRQLVTVHDHDSEVWRRVILGAGPLGLQMPAGIGTSDLDLVDAPSATWETSGIYTRAELSTVAADTRGRDATVAFPGWYQATGAYDSLTGVDLATLPGWDPAWRITPAAAALSLSTTHDDGTGEGAHVYVEIQ